MNFHKPHSVEIDVRSLQTAGYVSIPYPPVLRACMKDAMESWKRFCDLPLEEKNRLSGGDRINDFGYMYRNDNGPKADDKELFHALRSNFEKLIPLAKSIPDARATEFITAIDKLIEAMEAFVLGFAQSVEREYRLAGFADEVMASKDMWVFRYLHYVPGSRPTLANAHADRGGFTFHLGETESGGEYLDFENTWRPWPVSEQETIIFPSLCLQHRSQGVLKALWHRVVPNETTIKNGRYAMVTFVDFKMSDYFDTRRFRVQDFPEGFNYTMPFEDFAKLFVAK